MRVQPFTLSKSDEAVKCRSVIYCSFQGRIINPFLRELDKIYRLITFFPVGQSSYNLIYVKILCLQVHFGKHRTVMQDKSVCFLLNK